MSTSLAVTLVVVVVWAGLGLVTGLRQYASNGSQPKAIRITLAVLKGIVYPPCLLIKATTMAFLADPKEAAAACLQEKQQ